MERRTGAHRNPKHADSSSALNMLQQLQGINTGGSGSRVSSTHLMSAPNPIIPNILNSNDSGGSMSNSSTMANISNRGKKRPCFLREQDQYMPIANVVRIMRSVLPAHAKISDDAKETIQECVSEYISFITGEANDKCKREQRKTITAEDVLSAMGKLGFDDYLPALTLYLTRYRQNEHERTTQRTTVPTETYVYAPPPAPLPSLPSLPPLPPMVANSNSHYFDYGPRPSQQNMNMMTMQQNLLGPTMPNYGPGLGFQQGLNNPGMFDYMGLGGFYGNTPGAGPAGGSSSPNAGPDTGPNFDPYAQFFK